MESIISEVVTHQPNHQRSCDAYVIRQIFLDQWRVSDATIPAKTLTRGRSRHQRCSVRKGVPRNFTKFTGKHVCQRLWHTCFPVNLAKFLRTLFSQNTSGPLLLQGVLHLFTSQKYIFRSNHLEALSKVAALKNITGNCTPGNITPFFIVGDCKRVLLQFKSWKCHQGIHVSYVVFEILLSLCFC